jgi:hypothetical protein
VAPLQPDAVLCLDSADALAALRKALGDDAASGAPRRPAVPPARPDPDAQLSPGHVSRFPRSASTDRLAGPAAR